MYTALTAQFWKTATGISYQTQTTTTTTTRKNSRESVRFTLHRRITWIQPNEKHSTNVALFFLLCAHKFFHSIIISSIFPLHNKLFFLFFDKIMMIGIQLEQWIARLFFVLMQSQSDGVKGAFSPLLRSSTLCNFEHARDFGGIKWMNCACGVEKNESSTKKALYSISMNILNGFGCWRCSGYDK